MEHCFKNSRKSMGGSRWLYKAQNYGNYMRKCASGGQSLANAEWGVEMCGFVGKIDTEFLITNVHLYIIRGNPGPNILVAHFRM